MAGESILDVGRNLWRRESAARVAFLVDGAAYYAAFAAAVERAERSILLVGWDVNSHTRLSRPDAPAETLSGLLNRVVSWKPHLEVHLLGWDFAMVFALERELFPVVQLGWKTHRRIHFRLDSDHPLGAAHHQKIVVIDDVVAFSGGIDITTHRWDTRRHAPDDPRRKTPDNEAYKPFHDVQMAVDGPAAKALGELVRERWARATGSKLKPPAARAPASDPWPPGLVPDVTEVEIGIARTEPSFRGRPEVREVEALFVDAIARAKRSIYIENQYTTSAVVCEALSLRLAEKGGPEIVLVCPKTCSGWLEVRTMGVLRSRFLRRLRAADHEKRLAIYYPRVTEEVDVFVHAKVLVVDDELCRIGSANLSNRSMRVDTECDVVLESRGDPRVGAGIARFRDQLLGEHLGVPGAAVKDAVARHGSMLQAIEALRSGPRMLVPLPIEEPDPAEANDLLQLAADPERPVEPDALVEMFLFEDESALRTRVRRQAAVGIGLTAALALAWWLTPLGQWVNPSQLARYTVVLDGIQSSPLAPLFVMVAYVIGTLLMLPINVILLATGMAFGPLLGAGYALLGVVAASSAGYGAGQVLGRETLRRLSSARINKLSRSLSKRGVLAIAAARLVPVAPFGLVNLVAGAASLRFRQFFFGTLAGNLPGLVLVPTFGPGVVSALRTWEPVWIATAAGVVLGVISVALVLWRVRRKVELKRPHALWDTSSAGGR